MPLYDYECRDCGERFEALVLGRSVPSCPSCQSTNLEQLLSTFAVDSAGTRKTHFDAAKRQGAKARKEHAIAEHEQLHKNLEH